MIELTPREMKLIIWALNRVRQQDAIHAHTWEKAQIGSQTVFKRYTAVSDLLRKLSVEHESEKVTA